MKKIAWIVAALMLLTCLTACSGKTELEKAFTTVPTEGGLKIVGYSGSATTLEIPSTIGNKTVVEIGDEVFAQQYLLTEVVIPDTVHTIGDRAFQGCRALEKIVIPDSVKEIGDYSFFGCWGAKTIEIGAKLNHMGDQALQYCLSLEAFVVDEENNRYAASDDGVLFTSDYKTLLCYPSGAKMTSYTVPKNCTAISDYAFRNCANLETVTIGEQVKDLGDSVFYDCEELKHVNLGATVDYIGYAVFSGCTSLEEIVIPEGIKTIGYLLENGENGSTFAGCTSLKRVVLPASLTNVYANSFYECSSLAEIAFCGDEAAWKTVMVGQGNELLTSAAVSYNYKAD